MFLYLIFVVISGKNFFAICFIFIYFHLPITSRWFALTPQSHGHAHWVVNGFSRSWELRVYRFPHVRGDICSCRRCRRDHVGNGKCLRWKPVKVECTRVANLRPWRAKYSNSGGFRVSNWNNFCGPMWFNAPPFFLERCLENSIRMSQFEHWLL